MNRSRSRDRGGQGGNILQPTVTYTGGNQQRLGQGVGYYNFNRQYGLAYRNLLGSGNAFTQLHVGDSTTEGISDTNLRSDSVPSKLAAYFVSNGRLASTDNFMGDSNQGSTASYSAYNTKLAFFTGWNVSVTESLGGKAFSNSTNTNDISITAADTYNAIDVFTIGAGCTYGVLVNGVSMGTFSPSGATKTRVNLTGTVSIRIERTAGTGNVVGGVVRNTATPRIDIVNAGRGSSGTVYWTDNSSANRAINCLAPFGAEVVFINVLIGDWGDSSVTDAATSKANTETIINTILGYGGIPVLLVPHPTPTSIASAQRQADYTDTYYDLSDQYGLALIDMHAWLGNDYANAVTAGYTYDTSSHYNAVGYAAEANFIGAGLSLLAA